MDLENRFEDKSQNGLGPKISDESLMWQFFSSGLSSGFEKAKKLKNLSEIEKKNIENFQIALNYVQDFYENATNNSLNSNQIIFKYGLEDTNKKELNINLLDVQKKIFQYLSKPNNNFGGLKFTCSENPMLYDAKSLAKDLTKCCENILRDSPSKMAWGGEMVVFNDFIKYLSEN